jgi:aconitate hydratase
MNLSKLPNPFQTLRTINNDNKRYYYSLPALETQGMAKISRLPVSIRILLESLLRNCDGKRVEEKAIKELANWSPSNKKSKAEVPFVVSRVILQDFTGVPLLVDLGAMRDAVAEKKFDPKTIEPQVPVDLVIDHSVQVDQSGNSDAFLSNLKIEFGRNKERYEFLKWGQQAFETFGIVPPGIGIVHQVNLEHLATVVTEKKGADGIILYPDTLVGTDSHTTMIDALGVLGWGVGGIEAEAAMLGQPIALEAPEVIGVHLTGKLREGITATDLTLRVTEMLRNEKVVGKFVEFFGEGASQLTVADRATIANMAPEYGATVGFFPVDEKTIDYLRTTGRNEEQLTQIKEYLQAQKLFGMPLKGEIDYTKVLELDLASIAPCVSGPKRPQDRIDLTHLKSKFEALLTEPIPSGGYGKSHKESKEKVALHSDGSYSLISHRDEGGTPYLDENSKNLPGWSEVEMVTNRPFTHPVVSPGYGAACDTVLSHGSVVIAAITSCTNTSNPSVMIAAGLLAKKAVEKGLKVNPMIKTSLAPGSRVVTDYLEKTDLQKYLNALGFHLVAYGCTTCIGNSGPLNEQLEQAVKEHDLVVASVLSGNRNFEARIHGAVKANFLMSPPLVVAFAIAGKVNINMESEPLGYDREGAPVFLKDIWPATEEIEEAIRQGIKPEMFKKRYSHILEDNPVWKEIKTSKNALYEWDKASTYIQRPPFFEKFQIAPQKVEALQNMRPLALFGDSVTTDHISPAGAFGSSSSAGKYLLSLGVSEEDFNSYGSRRGNHHVMMRGTFANTRIKNKMMEGKEGGYTKLMPEGTVMPIFDACQVYAERKVPLIIFAGKDYGMGSSRDWAAKGTALLGVKAVVAESFERIHRSNLIGMGILPLEFKNEESLESLGITGNEIFSLLAVENGLKPRQEIIMEIKRNGKTDRVSLIARIDTAMEVEYYRHGGILPFVLRQLL